MNLAPSFELLALMMRGHHPDETTHRTSARRDRAVQPVILAVWFILPGLLSPFPLAGRWEFFACIAGLVIGAGAVILLGIPIFLPLRTFDKASGGRMITAGFLIASTPCAIVGRPFRYHGYTSGGNWFGHHVQFYVDGVATNHGLLSCVLGLMVFGMHGLLGALVFYILWRRRSDKSRHSWSTRPLGTPNHLMRGAFVDDFKAYAPTGQAVSSYVTLRTYSETKHRWEMTGLAVLRPAVNAEWFGEWSNGEMLMSATGKDPAGDIVRSNRRHLTPPS